MSLLKNDPLVEIVAPPLLSYAHAVAGAPPRLNLRLTPPGGQTLEDVQVKVSVEVDGQLLTRDSTVTIDQIAEPIVVDVDLLLDRTALLQLSVQSPAMIHLSLSAKQWETDISIDLPGATVLAARQWMQSGSIHERASTLATFVQPNQPEMVALCRAAAGELHRATGTSSLLGYQAGPVEVDKMVEALCRAIHSYDIAYANPPTNWSDIAQTIRSADDVLEGRLATCMDTTVLLSSALEYLGLEPLLFVLPNHIFVGYWRSDRHVPEQLAMSSASLMNHIDRGEIAVVETTILTTPGVPDFAGISRAAKRQLNDPSNPIDYVVSVREARAQGVGALPARGRNDDGVIIESEYVSVARSNTVEFADLPPVARRVQGKRAPERVEVWKRRLLDLSLRNRLINISDSMISRRSVFELAVPEPVIGAFEDLLAHGQGLNLRPAGERAQISRRQRILFREETDPPRLAPALADHFDIDIDIADEAYGTALQKLAKNARTLIEETGANNLYVAVGSLLWEVDGKSVRSPLILIPIELLSGSVRSLYRIQADPTGFPTPNYSLLERLKLTLGLELPVLADPPEDDAGIDIVAVLASVRNELAQNRLPFRVESTVYLGIFDFGGFRMWKDLEDSWEDLAGNSLVDHLINSADAPFEDAALGRSIGSLDELVSDLPIQADASQAEVIARALNGETMVVEGPPGTGKSQTITNLIVRAMASGQRVLFVAEKQAALGVVSRRLSAIGVGDLTLNLHDRSRSPAHVRQDILRALDLQADSDVEGVSAQRAMMSTTAGALRRYRDSLHEKNIGGFSFYSARTHLLANDTVTETIPMQSQVLSTLDKATVDSLRGQIPNLVDALSRRDPDYPAAFAYIQVPLAESSFPSFLQALTEAQEGYGLADTTLRELLSGGDSGFLDLVATVMETHWFDPATLGSLATFAWNQQAGELLSLMSQLNASPLQYFTPSVLDGPLGQTRAGLVEAKNSLFGKRRKAETAMGALVPYQTGQPLPESANDLLKMIDELIALQAGVIKTTALAESLLPGALQSWGGSWTPFDPAARAYLEQAIAWGRRVRYLYPAPGTEATRSQELAAQIVLGGNAAQQSGIIRDFLASRATIESLAPGLDAPHLLEQGSLPADNVGRLRSLRNRNDVNIALLPFWSAGLTSSAQMIAEFPGDPALLTVAFERGLATTSLQERADFTGLDGFDGARHMDNIRRFIEASKNLQKMIPGVLLTDILDARNTFVAQHDRRLGQLRRELVRKRGGRRIRELMGDFGDLISHITPCVLVSPDSVARFFRRVNVTSILWFLMRHRKLRWPLLWGHWVGQTRR